MTIEELEVLKNDNAVKAKTILEAEDGIIEDAQKLLDENQKISEKIEAFKSVEKQLLPVETKSKDIIMENTAKIIMPFSEASYKSLPFSGATGYEKAKMGYAFGMFALSTRGNQKAIQWLSENTSFKAVNETTNSAGGFLVPDELIAELLFLREQYGVVRQNSAVRNMNSDVLWIPKNSASTTAYWVGESTAITQSQPTFERVQILAKKLGILTAVTSEVNEDSIIEIGTALAQDMAWKFAQEEDRVCMIGSSATATDGNINGFITENLGVGSNAGSVNAATGSAANYNATTLANFRTMVGKLPLYADNENAKWYMSKAFFNDVVANRLDSLSGNAALDIMNFQSGRPTLYGYPIVYSQHLASTAAGTTGTALCALANLKTGTVFGDRRSVQISVSSDYLFNSDELAFKAVERFGFTCHDPGTSSAPGSVIVLKRLT
jgi:HK97 family phage major capsid protein